MREGAEEGRSVCAWCTINDSSVYSGCGGRADTLVTRPAGRGGVIHDSRLPEGHGNGKQQALAGAPPDAQTQASCGATGGYGAPQRLCLHAWKPLL